MRELIEYIQAHSLRGECQCGKCFDRGPDRESPPHSADVCFFWVSAANDPTAAELDRLLRAHYPDFKRLRDGPSYIEMGGELGDQGIALQLIGLGAVLGLWSVASPKALGFLPEESMELAGRGFVMPAGYRDPQPASRASGQEPPAGGSPQAK